MIDICLIEDYFFTGDILERSFHTYLGFIYRTWVAY